jgi:hypothetical protein
MLRKSLYFNYDFYAAQARKKCPEENTPQCGVPENLFELHIGKPILSLHSCMIVWLRQCRPLPRLS